MWMSARNPVDIVVATTRLAPTSSAATCVIVCRHTQVKHFTRGLAGVIRGSVPRWRSLFWNTNLTPLYCLKHQNFRAREPKSFFHQTFFLAPNSELSRVPVAGFKAAASWQGSEGQYRSEGKKWRGREGYKMGGKEGLGCAHSFSNSRVCPCYWWLNLCKHRPTLTVYTVCFDLLSTAPFCFIDNLCFVVVDAIYSFFS